MQKAVVATVAVAAVVVGAVTGGAAWSGSKVTARLEEQTAELQKSFPMLKVENQKFERGLFSSTRSFSIQLGCLPSAAQQAASGKSARPEALKLTWRDVVHHGPFPGGKSLGLASIDSELVSPPAYKARIEQLTGKRPLLSVHTTVELTGSTVSELTVPPLHYADPAFGVFDSKGLHGRVLASASASTSEGGTYSTELPGFELSSRATDGTSIALTVGPISGQTVISPRPDASSWLVPARSAGRVTSVELVGTAADSLGIKPVNASFSELRFDAESKLDGGLFSSTSHITGKGRVNQVGVDKVELRASVKRLHAASYQKLLVDMFGSVLSCDPAVQQAAIDSTFASAQKELASMLVHDPEYALDTLAVELGGKRAELSYSVGTRGVTAADAAQPLPAVLLTKGVLKASAKVHTGLIAQAIAQLGALDPGTAAAAGLPAGVAQTEQTLAMVNAMTDQFVQAGYIEREGESIKAAASYESGAVLINGKPMALPNFGAFGK